MPRDSFFGFLVLSPDQAEAEFYSATASLIPVLLLTLAVEGKTFGLSPMLGKLKTEARKLKTVETGSAPGFWGAIRIWAGVPYVLYLWERIVVSVLAFIVLAIAEFVALRPLATGHKTDGDPRFIYGALVAGFVAIGLLALVGTIGKDPD